MFFPTLPPQLTGRVTNDEMSDPGKYKYICKLKYKYIKFIHRWPIHWQMMRWVTQVNTLRRHFLCVGKQLDTNTKLTGHTVWIAQSLASYHFVCNQIFHKVFSTPRNFKHARAGPWSVSERCILVSERLLFPYFSTLAWKVTAPCFCRCHLPDEKRDIVIVCTWTWIVSSRVYLTFSSTHYVHMSG